ncbi:MAG: hypothetical protein GDA38_24355 [Hormoscilla sp. SP12CHS1]|nr:hypothetical protein [Hormoscilla sp. SP12CHS1]
MLVSQQNYLTVEHLVSESAHPCRARVRHDMVGISGNDQCLKREQNYLTVEQNLLKREQNYLNRDQNHRSHPN